MKISVFEHTAGKHFDFDETKSTEEGIKLPGDLVDTLKFLKAQREVYESCLSYLCSNKDNAPADLEKGIRGILDDNYRELWRIGQEFSKDAPYKNYSRLFRYVSDAALEKISVTKDVKCELCPDPHKVLFKVWITPNLRTICAKCIANGMAAARLDMEFHPTSGYSDNTEARYYQIFELAYRTPPIKSFCSGQEPYRWERHCGDFAVYMGDLEFADAPEDIRRHLFEKEGQSYSTYLDNPDHDWGIFHRFECIKCSEELFSYDYEF